MKTIAYFFFALTFFACSSVPKDVQPPLVLAFGSCSNQAKPNQLWKEILKTKPNAFIWLGDAIYPKEYNLEHLEKGYKTQTTNVDYQNLDANTQILGVYDDHDFGLNDGGEDNPIKKQAKSLFIDYIIEDDFEQKEQLKNADRGLFYSVKYDVYNVELIVLDTRYHRTKLKKSTNPNKRYDAIDKGTILGDEQWLFLEKTITNSSAKTILLVSSIQFLNNAHGYEKWDNMPHERDRLLSLLKQHPNKKFIVLSGDRHFSEVSEFEKITEITSSGLTEVYSLADERNSKRQGALINQPNFGMLNFQDGIITLKFIGKKNKVLKEYVIK